MTTETLADACKAIGLTSRATRLDREPPEGWHPGTITWRVTFRLALQGGSARYMRTLYRIGPALAHTTPRTADVMACVLSDTVAGGVSFNSYCREFGCDEDSRKAFRTWRKCCAVTRKLYGFLTTSDVNRLQRAEAP